MNLKGQKIHFMGAGGIGVSALAALARHAGAEVSACDRAANEMTELLEQQGIPVALGHGPAHVADCDLLVHTSAVPASHPERAAASSQERRGVFLARFLDRVPALGVCGTHGKTTTSWLLARILIQAGLDPAVFIGGVTSELPGGNYRLGTGPFVAELDESDGTFLAPKLAVAIITNVESDHLSHYGDDAALFAAFRSFADGVARDGILVAGVDNPVAKDIFDAHSGKKYSFGLTCAADFTADSLRRDKGETVFRIIGQQREYGEVALPMPGDHNVLNALAAFAAAIAFGVPAETACAALSTARGVDRRMERLGTLESAVLYSDYAHHPTEVAAAIAGLGQNHPGETLVVFQPHLFSRTRDYADAFGRVLCAADKVLLVDIYPAREEPLPGITSAVIADAMRRHGGAAIGPVSLEQVPDAVRTHAKGCEAVVMMGAGDIDGVARTIARDRGDRSGA